MSNEETRMNESCCCLKRKRPPNILIPTTVLKSPIFVHSTPRTDTVFSSANGEFADHVGVFFVKGKKKFMEDTHKIMIPCSNEAFFGVYDGHGGRKAANFVAQNLHKNILEMMGNCCADKEEAIKAAFLKTDTDFLKLGIGSGACCVTALIQGEEVVVSNLGDCRCVLSRGGVAEALTKDHRVENKDERKRIENKGGYVEFHRGAWRVHGVLSVSRSIGDAHLKDWVVAEPDSKLFLLTRDMEFLVLASDGLWEKVGNQETVDIVTRRLCLVDKKFEQSKDFSMNTSPKLRRVSLVRQQTGIIRKSPSYMKEVDCWEDDNASENESPKSKSRRISVIRRVKMKTESPTKENSGCYRRRPTSNRLVAACKELVDLALSRGSLDDITVMIIDLTHFHSRCNTQK